MRQGLRTVVVAEAAVTSSTSGETAVLMNGDIAEPRAVRATAGQTVITRMLMESA